ncbi:MAG TPA: hypothetical protein VJ890_28300 [Vineibacter sp.]|nr:hypothetical protein [Vineibacter sp.]
MAEQSSGGLGGGLYFIVGAVVVAVAVLGYVVFGGQGAGGGKKIDITIEAPKK